MFQLNKAIKVKYNKAQSFFNHEAQLKNLNGFKWAPNNLKIIKKPNTISASKKAIKPYVLTQPISPRARATSLSSGFEQIDENNVVLMFIHHMCPYPNEWTIILFIRFTSFSKIISIFVKSFLKVGFL